MRGFSRVRVQSALAALVWWQFAAAVAVAQSVVGTTSQDVVVDGDTRTYRLHVPPQYDSSQPTPVVLAFHGAFEDAATIETLSGLSQKADAEGFIVVYPNGTGFGSYLFWNTGGWRFMFDVDEIAFVETILDDLPNLVNVDTSRVFATGFSLGGMLCYELAAELPDRIAAIASVDGTISVPDPSAAQPVPVLHFHGTADPIIPYIGPINFVALLLRFESVNRTIDTWIDINQCSTDPVITNLPDKYRDGTKVQQYVYSGGLDGTEVTLIKIKGGGHTWPGTKPHFTLYGISTKDIQATPLIWQFFQKHALN